MATFAQRLRELRKQSKLTQQDVANKLGITESAYGYYEQSRREPSQETLNKLADIFEVDLDYLLGRSNERLAYHSTSGGRAYYGGGEDWTEEEHQLAQAAVEDWRRRKKEMEQRLQQNNEK